MRPLLTAAEAREDLDYDAETGALTWRVTRGRALAGEAAGCISGFGYIVLKARYRRYPAHRVAWLHFYGEWPKGVVDHINGIKTDNRIANLRDVTLDVNSQNKRHAQTRSKTGLLGVCESKPTKKGRRFAAQIFVGGRLNHLGTYSSAEEAYQVYVAAKRQMHPGNTL